MLRTLLAATAFAALATAAPLTPAAAQDFDFANMSDSQKSAFGDAVREYLMANPQVLVEAINELEAKQQAQQADNDKQLIKTNAKDIFEDGYSWVGGNPDGDITVVEFMDYKCTYCKKAYDEVSDLISKDGNIRFIVKEFPILGQQSELAARFAVATKQIDGDDAYAKMHDTLMKARGNLTVESLSQIAKDQGLDPDPILKQMNDDSVTEVLRQNYQLAQRMAISGTPAFVIGGQMLRGYAPEAAMAKMVAEERQSE
ncbi:disulfide bond formation protein DsbA [Thioclava sediminum]|uniref:Disulfide bond formation protein DsbA n=1 Tax=Thioclava sediminum TaxID=1915319 RepID=A0ABX3MVP9_9RHOB|nr:DsbA family protein [Thioclava sediminum]OOY23772.1 disulfide bond formation protein DsbA [Thioclava sediminum]